MNAIAPPSPLRIALAWSLAALLLLIAACGGGAGAGPKSVNIILESDTTSFRITVGRSRRLKVTAHGDNAALIRWSVDEPNGGTITAEGLYTAPSAPGEYHVRAAAGADPVVYRTWEVSVVPAPVAVNLVASRLDIKAGEELTLTPEFEGATATITPGVGKVQNRVAVTVQPIRTTTYTLQVTNGLEDEAVLTRTVNVAGSALDSHRPVTGPETARTGSIQAAAVTKAGVGDTFRWAIEGGEFLGPDPEPASRAVAFRAGAPGAFTLKVWVGHGEPPPAGAQATYTLAGTVLPAGPADEPELSMAPFVTAHAFGLGAEVAQPRAHLDYQWDFQGAVASGGGQGAKVTFGTGGDPILQAQVTARDRTTGATFSGTAGAVVVPRARVPRIRLQERSAVGVEQFAYLEEVHPGETYRWELPAGSLPGGQDQATGALVRFKVPAAGIFQVRCVAINIAGDPSAKAEASGLAEDITAFRPLVIQVDPAVTGASGPHPAKVALPNPGYRCRWSISGGTLDAAEGPEVTFRAGAGPMAILTCEAVDPATGASLRGSQGVLLVPKPAKPVLKVSEAFAGRAATVWADQGGRAGQSYQWTLSKGKQDSTYSPGTAVFPFTPDTSGELVITCRATNLAGMTSEETTIKVQVQPPPAPGGPAPGGPAPGGPAPGGPAPGGPVPGGPAPGGPVPGGPAPGGPAPGGPAPGGPAPGGPAPGGPAPSGPAPGGPAPGGPAPGGPVPGGPAPGGPAPGGPAPGGPAPGGPAPGGPAPGGPTPGGPAPGGPAPGGPAPGGPAPGGPAPGGPAPGGPAHGGPVPGGPVPGGPVPSAPIPVRIVGAPPSAPPSSGPFNISVEIPQDGATYTWSILTPGTGALATTTGTTNTFTAGTGDVATIVCQALNAATGATGLGIHVVSLRPAAAPPAGPGKEIPVKIIGPETAPPSSPGFFPLLVENGRDDVTYTWSISTGNGTLSASTGKTTSFRTGKGLLAMIVCRAHDPATGATGVDHLPVLLLGTGPVPLIEVHGPNVAKKDQGPLVAWVDHPVPGMTYLWEVIGGDRLSAADKDYVEFKAGHGAFVKLKCSIASGGVVASQGSHTVALVDDLPAPATPGPEITTHDKRAMGKKGLPAEVILPDGGDYTYHWTIDGGTLDLDEGSAVTFTSGTGARTVLRCRVTNRNTGAMEMAGKEIALTPALLPLAVSLPARIYEGQMRVVKVTNVPTGDDGWTGYDWTLEGLEDRPPAAGAPRGECHFLATAAGPARITCRASNPNTLDEQVWTQDIVVLPPKAIIDPVRIQTFVCDPAGPLPADATTATLRWTLDKDPDRLVLREELTGREWALNPGERSFTLGDARSGPLRGRQKFTLTTFLKDTDLDEDSTASEAREVVRPGVSVLAGNARDIGSGYMKTAVAGVTPWEGVTGLAWEAPWLYFSQGEQHTIRKVNTADLTQVLEVAGMRGLPGTGTPNQDRLFKPGQLIHRHFTPAGGAAVDDWLVLQPGANCIQAFTEGDVARTMRVLVGPFTHTPAAYVRGARPGPSLRYPAAMAVHAATGMLFVADNGNRAIKMYAPAGGNDFQSLAEDVEADGIAVDDQGNVFYSESKNHVVKVIRHLGGGAPAIGAHFAAPALFAGAQGQAGAAEGGRLTEARFRQPMALAIDPTAPASLVIADTGNHLVRRVPLDLATPGAVETIGGNLYHIKAGDEPMAVHASGFVALADPGSHTINLFSKDLATVTPIPAAAGLEVRGIAMDRAGNVFIASPSEHVVRVLPISNGPLADGMVPVYGAAEIFAGTPGRSGKSAGLRVAPGTTAAPAPPAAGGAAPAVACFMNPTELAMDPRDPAYLLITDPGNDTLWRVPVDLGQNLHVKSGGRPVIIEKVANDAGFMDGPQADSKFATPRQLCPDGHGTLYIQDQAGNGQAPVIRVLAQTGEVTTLGGINENTSSRGRADGQGAAAGFNAPAGIGVDASGAVFVADGLNRCVRRIDPSGAVTVASGSTKDPEKKSSDDDENVENAKFGALAYLGVDFGGRVMVTEPGLNRLRLVDFRGKPDPRRPDIKGVTTLTEALESDKVCVFPASFPFKLQYAFGFATPAGGGNYAVKAKRLPSTIEVVVARTPLQAFCADRNNRIVVVLPPDPALPGALQLRRYGCDEPRTSAPWRMEAAQPPLQVDTGTQQVDGRPYATAVEPQITAIATDSRNNVYLADSANATVWKVNEALTELSRVAGAYPYLGPIGHGLDQPLLPMQGIALTPDDDVVVTCGNAVLQITQEEGVPRVLPQAWRQADVKLWPPVAAPAKTAGGPPPPPKPKEEKLQDDKLNEVWVRHRAGIEKKRQAAEAALQKARVTAHAASLAAQADRTSRPLQTRAAALAAVVARDQKALALAKAGDEAVKAGYQYLLNKDRAGNLTGPAGMDASWDMKITDSRSQALQARYQSLELDAELGAMRPTDPRRDAFLARIAFLGAVERAKLAETELKEKERIRSGFKVTSPAADRNRAQQALDLAKRANDAAAADLATATAAAKAFDRSHPGTRISEFLPWTIKDEKTKTNGPFFRPEVMP